MEQSSVKQKKLTFLEKSSTRLGIVVLLVGLVAGYFLYMKPMQEKRVECERYVSYHPAGTEKVSGANMLSNEMNQESYYSYLTKKFETKEEALEYCIQSD